MSAVRGHVHILRGADLPDRVGRARHAVGVWLWRGSFPTTEQQRAEFTAAAHQQDTEHVR
ncbi:hypothetical protein ACL02T_16020 [Pseudonocardia sp. RS010]|uniref:hypothetical protein n=1 Tax=Pseudonocardia sp. RS010 TaxID=3385979 RepID=UPI0039A39891